MPTATVLNFLISAPTILATDSLSTVATWLADHPCEQVVVLNEHQRPIGWVRSLEVLTVAWRRNASPSSNHTEDYGIPPDLMRSLPSVTNSELALELGRQGMAAPLPDTIAIVDPEGCYLGLLNQTEFWRFIALQPSASTKPPESPAWPIPLDPSPTALLVQVLDHLPLPLMLQTSSGTVIAQNQIWQRQIGEVPHLRSNLQTVKQAATDPSILAHPWESEQFSSLRQPSLSLASIAQGYQVTKGGDVLSANQCRIDADTNTCICVCPTSDGSNRLWQFTTVSLGDVRSPDYDAAYDSLWLVLAQDYTEQQRVGQELAAKNADLIQLNRLKDEFLACISHELKTPLTSILGLSSLLKDQAIGAMSDRQARYAQLIYQSSRHLMLIVNDILDLTRIETGQMELILEPVNLEVVCHRAYEQVTQGHGGPSNPLHQEGEDDPTASCPSIQVTIRTDQACLLADELRLRQMLANLLSNAMKFTTASGAVGLEVEDWGHWLAFTVWDTGMGIPADKQHLIFQKFQQLEQPLTRSFEGTGLGLVITQRLARLHGGEVTFTSKEGEGSRFTILLPVVPPQAKQTLDPAEAAVILPHKRSSNNRLMLVMESVPQLLDDVTYHLGKLGYQVAIARSGTEALEKTRQLQPAMVFLDPVLPQLSGWDVLTLLKSDDDTSHIPIIAMTTQAESQRAESAGVDGVLSLPIDGEALEQLMDQQLAIATPADQYPSLTVLHLGQPSPWTEIALADPDWVPPSPEADDRSPVLDLNHLLHPYHCRVLEVDDIDQADVLSRVWRPDVVLLSDRAADPVAYFQQIQDCSYLSTLPMITLTAELTQAANQYPEITVFPCLDPAAPVSPMSRDAGIPTLLEVIRVATGTYWTPHVLVVDVTTTGETPLLQPPLQYLQQSGLASVIAQSPTEMAQALQQKSGDLLLLCTDTLAFNPALVQVIQILEQAPIRPPVLVWQQAGRQGQRSASPEFWSETQTLRQRLDAIAAQMLPLDILVEDVILRIQSTLGQQYSQSQ